MRNWRKITRTKKIGCLPKLMLLDKKVCASAYVQVSSQGCWCVHTHVYAYVREKHLTVRFWVWGVETDLTRWWKLDSKTMKVIGKGTYSGHQKHWSQGTNPCYLTEWAISKWNYSGAPRMPGRKERQEERAWGVCRGKATTPAVYEK